MKTPIIPTDYEQWKDCIVNEWNILLTISFVEKRISEMNDVNSEYTLQFLKCYGEAQYENTKRWLLQAKNSLQ